MSMPLFAAISILKVIQALLFVLASRAVGGILYLHFMNLARLIFDTFVVADLVGEMTGSFATFEGENNDAGFDTVSDFI